MQKRVIVLPETSCHQEWQSLAWTDSKICVRPVGDKIIPCPVRGTKITNFRHFKKRLLLLG